MYILPKKEMKFFLVTMAVIGFTACNQANRQENQGETEQTVAAEITLEEQPGPASPDISFADESGKTTALSSLKGKVVFVNFWATWCPPCIQEMPSIHTLKQSFDGEDIVFLMVDVDNDIGQSSAFMKKNKYDLPVYVPTSDIPSVYLEDAIPTTVIFDKQGELVVRAEGGRDYTDAGIVQALRDLVESE